MVNMLLCFREVSYDYKVGYCGLLVWIILTNANPHVFGGKSLSNLQNKRLILQLKEMFLCV
jgi:hypothetical protein